MVNAVHDLRGNLSGYCLFRIGCILVAAAVLSVFALGQQEKTSIASIESLIRSHQYDLALQSVRSALKEKPSDFRLWTLEGIVLSIKGSNQDAIGAFEKALKLSPDYSAALKGEAQMLYQVRDKRAVPLLERILKADPKDATAHEMLAVLSARQGNCKAAVENFVLIAEMIKTHPDALEAYGSCLVQLDQIQSAIPIFEQLVALLPQRTYPKYDLAVLLIQNKQYAEAIRVIEPLLSDEKVDPELLSVASEAYEALGDTPKAVLVLRQAIVLDPTNANYYAAFAGLCLAHDSFQVGIDMLDAGLSRIPNAPSLYISRGALYAQLAEFDKAEEDFKRAETLDSAQGVSSFALGITEIQMNHTDEALSTIRERLKRDPDNPLLNYALAEVLMRQGAVPGSAAFDQATAAARLALKGKPELVAARDLLASIYIHSEQYDLAAEECRISLQYDPSDEGAIYHLIIALRHSGKKEEIQELVKRLSELQKASRQKEDSMKRYKLIEQEPAPVN